MVTMKTKTASPHWPINARRTSTNRLGRDPMTVSRHMLLALAVVGFPASAHAEGGTVTFANHSGTKIMNSLTGGAVTNTEIVRAALYWAPSGSNDFVQIGTFVTVGIPAPGLFFGGTRISGSNTVGGTVGQFQVRAWSGGFASYETA